MCPGFGIINNRVIAINSRVESPRRLLTLELRIEFITHIVCRILIVGHVLQPVYVVGVGVAALSIGGWGGGEDTWTLLLDCLLGRLPVNIMNPGSASYLMNGQRDRVYLLFAMQFAILSLKPTLNFPWAKWLAFATKWIPRTLVSRSFSCFMMRWARICEWPACERYFYICKLNGNIVAISFFRRINFPSSVRPLEPLQLACPCMN